MAEIEMPMPERHNHNLELMNEPHPKVLKGVALVHPPNRALIGNYLQTGKQLQRQWPEQQNGPKSRLDRNEGLGSLTGNVDQRTSPGSSKRRSHRRRRCLSRLNERFRQEPTAGNGRGFFIGPRLDRPPNQIQTL